MRLSDSFHNRDRERETIRAALDSPRSELIILYGRRGIGKSALLERALSEGDRPYLFYRATRRAMPLQLNDLTTAAREAFPAAFLAQPFSSVSVFLDFLTHLAETHEAAPSSRPIIAVLDEIPYLADVDPGLLTVLQHWWDANKRRPNLKLFLAGSYLSFMERQVLDRNAPLYNRRTGAMKLAPMDFAEAALFFPDYSPEEKMIAYAVLGGMPSYLEQFDASRGIEENLKATVLRANTYLSEEPDWLLREELRRDVTYGSILRAVALGERRPSEIARAIGRTSAQDVAPALETLRELDLLTREVPVTEERSSRSRNSLYLMADPYLDFYYRFVDANRGLVERGLGDRVWERSIGPSLHRYVSSPAFERACRQYLWRALVAGALPGDLSFTSVGRWWWSGDCEIDVVGLNEGGRVVLAGSCKWTESPMDVDAYAALIGDLKRSGLEMEDSQTAAYFLFSRSGFTSRLRRIAADQEPRHLLLVDLNAMYRV